METPKTFFAANFKFLRIRKKITQEVLAQQLDMTRAKLDALEMGRVKSPQPEDFLKYSQYFKISIDSLIKIDLAKLGELKLRELQAGNDVYMTGSKIRVLAITVDQKNKENIEYVPIKAKAGYAAGCSDPEYLAGLPKISLGNLSKHGTLRMFPITGDSMLPVPADSEIIGEYVEDWRKLKPETPCIVILKGQDFVFKLVTLQNEGKLLLSSLNPEYKPYVVEAADVLELWKYYKHQTGTLPQLEAGPQNIAHILRDIQLELLEIKNKK